MGAGLSVLYSWDKPKIWQASGTKEIISFLQRTDIYGGPSGHVPIPQVVRKAATPKEIYKNQLMCIRGIGVKTAKRIYKIASSWKDLIYITETLTPKQFSKQVKGLTEKAAQRLFKVLT
jgi:ERCC4-type nuclease